MKDESKSLTQIELSSLVDECRSLIKGRRILEFRDLAPGLESPLLAGAEEKFIMLVEDADSNMQRIVRLVLSVTSGLNYMLVSPRPQRRLKKGEGSWFAQGLHAQIAGSRIRAINVEPKDRIVTLAIENRDRLAWSLKFELFGRRANILLLDEELTILRALRESRTEARHIAEGLPYPPPVRVAARRKATAEQPSRFDLEGTSALGGLALNESADRYFHEIEGHAQLEGARRALRSQCGKETKRARKAIVQTDEKIARAGEAEKIKVEGDLLKAHFHLLKRGMDKVDVTNIFSADQESITIALDPKLDPARNLEAIYKRYRKTSRSRPHLESLRATYAERLEQLNQMGRRLEQAVAIEEIVLIHDEMIAAGVIKQIKRPPQSTERLTPSRDGRLPSKDGRLPSKDGRKPSAKPFASKNIRKYLLTRDQEVFVGKDGETNHRLLHLARGRDIWLHCHNTPGAHVVLPMAKNQNPSLDELLAAGQLALHFSQLRGAEQADVIYTPRKYVRAIKGGKKGQVTVERFKTLHIRRNRALLETILNRAGD